MSTATPFTLALRIACGDPVTQAEARSVLAAGVDCEDTARLDRFQRRKARDEALRDAADELGGEGLGAWALAELLEAAVLRFESRVWPRLRAGLECTLSPSDEALYRAYLSGQHIPRTQRRLYDLLA